MGLRGGGFEKHCTRASLRSDTVEDLIRLSVEGPSLEDVDARESVASWFSQGSNQNQITLLSHHHSTSALVSEILMSVLQTVQKNSRQFTY